MTWRLIGLKDDKTSRKGKVVAFCPCRLKREDCPPKKTYDFAFSQWEILIGPDDWANYSLGKDGAERYRTRNLAHSCSCPGIYELGVARLSSNSSRRFDPKDIVIVYLGQAENVRTRLQHYGRTGSHLEPGDSTVRPGKNPSKVKQRRPGLFEQVFSLGFSIMFRWSPTKSKREAIEEEARLLKTFDYAWNRISNSVCRYEEILLKLEDLSRSSSHIYRYLAKIKPWNWKFFIKKSLNNSKPIETNDSCLQPIQWKNHPEKCICGATEDDGSVCWRSPIPGRKRCGEHKGKRVNRRSSLSIINGEKGATKEFNHSSTLCGVFLDDGSICSSHPQKGRKRCHLHKGRRIIQASLQFHHSHECERTDIFNFSITC